MCACMVSCHYAGCEPHATFKDLKMVMFGSGEGGPAAGGLPQNH